MLYNYQLENRHIRSMISFGKQKEQPKEIKILNPKLSILSNTWNAISFIIFILGAKLGGVVIGLILVGIAYGFGYITTRLIAKLFSIDLYVVPTQQQLEKIKADEIKKTKTQPKSIIILIGIGLIALVVLLLMIYLFR